MTRRLAILPGIANRCGRFRRGGPAWESPSPIGGRFSALYTRTREARPPGVYPCKEALGRSRRKQSCASWV